LAIVFEDSFDKFETLSEGLVLYLELEAIGIFLVDLSLHLFNIVSELGVSL
jgi:hypothetical protein